MSEKTKLALKIYAIVDLIIAIIAYVCFQKFGHLVEATWTEEILKWILMTIVVIVIFDVIIYALVGTYVSRKINKE